MPHLRSPAAWKSQAGWTSHMAAGFPRASMLRNQGRNHRASYDLTLEYVQHQSGYKEPAQIQCIKD